MGQRRHPGRLANSIHHLVVIVSSLSALARRQVLRFQCLRGQSPIDRLARHKQLPQRALHPAVPQPELCVIELIERRVLSLSERAPRTVGRRTDTPSNPGGAIFFRVLHAITVPRESRSSGAGRSLRASGRRPHGSRRQTRGKNRGTTLERYRTRAWNLLVPSRHFAPALHIWSRDPGFSTTW